jgi:hypothetical protein
MTPHLANAVVETANTAGPHDWLADVNAYLAELLASRKTTNACIKSELDFNLKAVARGQQPYESVSEALTRVLYLLQQDGSLSERLALAELEPLVRKHMSRLCQETRRCASCYKTRTCGHPGVFGARSDCRACSRLYRDHKDTFWSSYVFVSKTVCT